MQYTGQTALVTGASTGMGAAFARGLAARGADLILVARSEGKLKALADELNTRHGVRVDVLPADLSAPRAGIDLAAEVNRLGRTVDVLINNAGFATHGDVADADPARLHEQVQLNVAAVVDLTTAFLPGMIGRKRGSIVNVASTAAFQPVPHMAVYAASKAFVLSFTEAAWSEAKPAGVRVLALCPGATDTPFFNGIEGAQVGRRRTPETVVQTAFRALDRGRPSVVDGRQNALLAMTPRLFPRRTILRVSAKAVGPAPTAN
jgi:short-subunit dehydrogenase